MAGNAARLAAARRHVRVDGVATECGMARGDPAGIPELLTAHAKTAELAAGWTVAQAPRSGAGTRLAACHASREGPLTVWIGVVQPVPLEESSSPHCRPSDGRTAQPIGNFSAGSSANEISPRSHVLGAFLEPPA